MDANGTRFHLLLQREEWLSTDQLAFRDQIDWDGEAHQVVLERRALTVEEARGGPGTASLSLADRRAAARERYGGWLRIDRAGSAVEIDDPGTGGGGRFWPPADVAAPPERSGRPGGFRVPPPPPPTPDQLRGLTVTRDQYLLVGRLRVADVLVFDLHAGGEPVVLDLGEPVALLDAAAAATGEVWLLDRPDDGPGRLWLLDRLLRPCPLTTATGEPGSPPTFTPQGADDAAGPVVQPRPGPLILPGDPIAVAALGDGVALILDRDPRGVRRVDAHDPTDDHPLLDLPEGARARVAHDLAVLDPGARRRSGLRVGQGARFVVADISGDQADAYVLEPVDPEIDGSPLTVGLRAETHLPMHGSLGGTIAEDGLTAPHTVHYESADRMVPLLAQPRRRYRDRGLLITAPLDAVDPGCVWHRVALDGCIPPGTSVAVSSRAADDLDELQGAVWHEEPAPYLRHAGSELAWHDVATDRAHGRGTWELLLQAATGRYLQLRLALSGDGLHTPRLDAARVHFPRYSYLQAYLPDTYAEQPAAASFVERLLANVEGVATRLEDRVAQAQRLHSVAAAPDEALDWLASWLGTVLDPDWSADRRRAFLTHAADLFRERGTVPGLIRALRIACDEEGACPELFTGPPAPPTMAGGFRVRVVERFTTRTLPTAAGWRAADQAELTLPRWIEKHERWSPDDGRDDLVRRWTQHTEAAGIDTPFPVREPTDEPVASVWESFRATQLRTAWADVTEADRDAWKALLRRRYPTPAALDRAWRRIGGRRHRSFAAIGLPSQLPEGAAFRDWVDLVTIILPAARAAHRLEVLVPVGFDDPEEERERRLDRAAAAAEAQRPAHVLITVHPYWAACRVGAARIGHETVVGESSRYAAIALDHSALARGHLGGRHPYDVTERTVLGRDPLGPGTSPQRQDNPDD